MPLPCLCPIVEGHGEAAAVPKLLHRLLAESGHAGAWRILDPIREPGSRLRRPDDLHRVVNLAASLTPPDGAILIMLDADDDCPATLGPELLRQARETRPDRRIGVVLPNREYEAWFIAARVSLADPDTVPPACDDPDGVRDAKGWLKRHVLGGPYRPRLDQSRLTSTMDLAAAAAGSRSFRKLCTELAALLDLDLPASLSGRTRP